MGLTLTDRIVGKITEGSLDRPYIKIESRRGSGNQPVRQRIPLNKAAGRTMGNLRSKGYESDQIPMDNTGVLFAKDILQSAVAFQKPGW